MELELPICRDLDQYMSMDSKSSGVSPQFPRANFKELALGWSLADSFDPFDPFSVCSQLLASSTDFHPLLTGGIIPTSSPGLISNPSEPVSDFESGCSSISTYSKFTVTAQLLSTFSVKPG